MRGRWWDERSVTVDIGNRLRIERMRAKMSQDDLGQKLGVSFQQIQKYESGANQLMSSRVLGLSHILASNPHTLLGWQQPRTTATLHPAQIRLMELCQNTHHSLWPAAIAFFEALNKRE